MTEVPLPPHLLALGALPSGYDGSGVTVALLDAAVCRVPGLREHVQVWSAEGAPVAGDDPPDHATRCASLIASRHPDAPGVAPGAALISVDVTSEHKRAIAPVRVAHAFDLARSFAVDLVCCCFVLPDIEPELARAVRGYLDQGGLVVGAAGNSPARRRFPFVRSIDGTLVARAAESTHEAFPGEIRAPGEGLRVLTHRGEVDRSWRGQSSGAAALVAGVIAVALSTESPGEDRREAAARLVRLVRTSGAGIDVAQMQLL